MQKTFEEVKAACICSTHLSLLLELADIWFHLRSFLARLSATVLSLPLISTSRFAEEIQPLIPFTFSHQLEKKKKTQVEKF